MTKLNFAQKNASRLNIEGYFGVKLSIFNQFKFNIIKYYILFTEIKLQLPLWMSV